MGEDVILYWNSTGAQYTHDVSAMAFITEGVDGTWQFSPIPGSFDLILNYNKFSKTIVEKMNLLRGN